MEHISRLEVLGKRTQLVVTSNHQMAGCVHNVMRITGRRRPGDIQSDIPLIPIHCLFLLLLSHSPGLARSGEPAESLMEWTALPLLQISVIRGGKVRLRDRDYDGVMGVYGRSEGEGVLSLLVILYPVAKPVGYKTGWWRWWSDKMNGMFDIESQMRLLPEFLR